MAQYKVIQDIEAEDKLVGPFSLRQFIYAAVAAIFGYLSVIAATHGAAFMIILFAPPMLFCMFFAWPWSPDQPTEVWALARIRFYLKPRKRIWDQSGAKDLVTITVPKRVEKVYTDGLSRTEVKSRLSALAETIDSRGWAIKNSAVNVPTLPSFDQSTSDRLVTTGSMPQPVSDIDITENDDILDAQYNPIAQQFDQMMKASADAHRQQLMSQMQAPEPAAPPAAQPAVQATQQNPPADYWFLSQPQSTAPPTVKPDPSNVMFANPTLVQPGAAQPAGPVAAVPTQDEAELVHQLAEDHLKNQQAMNTHLKTIQPMGAQPPQQTTQQTAQQAVTAQSDAAILNLANNNDLDIATLARQAKKDRGLNDSDDEVVVSLR